MLDNWRQEIGAPGELSGLLEDGGENPSQPIESFFRFVWLLTSTRETRHARLQLFLDENGGETAHGSFHRGHLQENIVGACALFDHLTDGSNVPLDPRELAKKRALRRLCEVARATRIRGATG